MSDEYVPPSNVVARVGAGVVGGLAGGAVLGATLQVMGELDEIGRLAGSVTVSGSWLVLLTICLVAGALYGGLFGTKVSRQPVAAAGIGLVYGALWWAILPLLAIPVRTGGRLFDIDGSMVDLVAYAAFGIVTGLCYAMFGPKRRYYHGRRSWDFVYAMPGVRRRRRHHDDDD